MDRTAPALAKSVRSQVVAAMLTVAGAASVPAQASITPATAGRSAIASMPGASPVAGGSVGDVLTAPMQLPATRDSQRFCTEEVRAETRPVGAAGTGVCVSRTVEVVSEPLRAMPTTNERGSFEGIRIRMTTAWSPTPCTAYASTSWMRGTLQPEYQPMVVSKAFFAAPGEFEISTVWTRPPCGVFVAKVRTQVPSPLVSANRAVWHMVLMPSPPVLSDVPVKAHGCRGASGVTRSA